MTKGCNVELDVFCVRSDLKLDGNGFVGDGAGRNGTPINDLKLARRGLESEGNGVGLSKLDVDEARGSTRIDESKGWCCSAVHLDIDRHDDIFFVF